MLCTGDNGEQFIVEMQRADHDNFEDRCIFYLSRLKSAERRGMREGIEKGKEEGVEQGKHETALAIARKMKEENFDPVKIAGFTALSMEEIQSL